MQDGYLDFVLEIGVGSGREYPVMVVRSPAGEARETMYFPFDALALESRLQDLQIALLRSSGNRRLVMSPGQKAVQDFGMALFDALFTGEVRSRYDVGLRFAVERRNGLRLKLKIQPPELAMLPWEFLYDPRQAEFVCLSSATPIVRYMELPQPIPLLAITLPLRILSMVASPSDQALLDVASERQRVENALDNLRRIGLVELSWLEGQTWRDLQRAMRAGPWHVFHFIGHGGFDPARDEGVVVLPDDDGRSLSLRASDLARLLSDHRSLRLVVLNACESGREGGRDIFASTAAMLVRRGIPAVVAMQYEISDWAAVEFGRGFYEALADGLPVDTAMSEARKAMSLAKPSTVEWGIPVLYMRSRDGALFELSTEKASQQLKPAKPTAAEDRQQRISTLVLEVEDHLTIGDWQKARLRLAELNAVDPGNSDWNRLVVKLEQRERRAAVIGRNKDVLSSAADLEAIGQVRHMLVLEELEGRVRADLQSFQQASQDVETALRWDKAYNQRLALGSVQGRLDRLVQDLSRPDDREALLFVPIAETWRELVAAYIRQLADAVRTNQAIDNPYVVGKPLNEQEEIFTGRVDVGVRIEQLLLDQRRSALLLYGQRRMGKTSLLKNLGRLLPSTIVSLFVDLQGPVSQASTSVGFLYNISQAIIDSARQHRGLELYPLSYDILKDDPFTRFYQWLNEVEKALGRRTALLTLDEFEVLDRAISRGRFDEEDVLGMLRHLIQHRPRFRIILAGSHTLDELQRWASYLINVQVVNISYLKKDEALQLIEHPVKDFTLRYQPDASHRALVLTRGHPFLVQLLCFEIVELKNEQEPATRQLVTVTEVEAAASEALSHGGFFFIDIERNQVDADGLAILRVLAAQGEGAAMSREQLVTQLADPARLERSLTSLIQRELIEPADGGYRFQVELIRRWFAKRSS